MDSSAFRRRAVLAVLAAAGCLVSAGVTDAGPIVNMTTGLSLAMQPGTTGSMTAQFTNVGDASQGVNTYTLGIMLVQTSGSSTLTFDAWTKPGAPLLIGDEAAEYTPFDPPSLAMLNSPVTLGGTDYYAYYPVQAAATDGFNYLLAASATKNVGLMAFTSDGDGTWDVYVVNQAPQGGGLPVSLLQTADATAYGFGNLPATNGSAVKIGEITVVSAVPEPSTAALAGAAVVAACLPGLRRRLAAAASRRRAAAAAGG